MHFSVTIIPNTEFFKKVGIYFVHIKIACIIQNIYLEKYISIAHRKLSNFIRQIYTLFTNFVAILIALAVRRTYLVRAFDIILVQKIANFYEQL